MSLQENEHKDVAENAIQAIVGGNFQVAAQELRTLKNNGASSNIYNKVLDYLGAIVTTSCDDALRQCGLLRNFDEKEIQSLISAFTKIKSIETYLLMELKEEQKGLLKGTKEKVQDLVIQKLSKIVNGIKESIRAYNFLEAQNKKDDVTLILQTLGTYLDGLEQVDEHINELEKYEKEIISEIKKKYENMNIETYYLDPPKKIYEKFLKVEDKSEEYCNLVSELKLILDKKIREGYLEAKQTNPFSEALKKFKAVESAIKTLPEDLQHQLQSELVDAKEDTKAHQQEFIEDIKLAIKAYDAITIINCLHSPEGAHSKNEIQRQIQEAIQELNKKIEDHLSKNEIAEALHQIEIIIDFSVPLGESMPAIKQIAILAKKKKEGIEKMEKSVEKERKDQESKGKLTEYFALKNWNEIIFLSQGTNSEFRVEIDPDELQNKVKPKVTEMMNKFSKLETCIRFQATPSNIIFRLEFLMKNRAEKVFDQIVELLESNS